MKKLIKVFVLLLLLINGTGAIYGGSMLMLHPDGSAMRLSLDWLKNSPFDDYLIPGIILFVANGLFSFCVSVAIIVPFKNYHRLIVVQGAILTGWILVEILMLREANMLHVLFATVGILLIYLGWIFRKMNLEEKTFAE